MKTYTVTLTVRSELDGKELSDALMEALSSIAILPSSVQVS
jgi:hypothetical protein